MSDDIFGEVISRYSRAQAIADGVLVDVSELAREAGFKFPVAITSRVHAFLEPSPGMVGQDYTWRLWDVFMVMLHQIRRGAGGERIDFAPYFITKESLRKPRPVALYGLCGPGDNAEPVITIMFPDED